MADLTQNVKYIVDVDLTALDKLREAMQSVVTTSKGLDGAFGRVQKSTKAAMDSAAVASAGATVEMSKYEKAAARAAKAEETRLRKLERERDRAAKAQQAALEKQARAVERAQAAEMRAYNQGMRNLKEYTDFAKRKAKERQWAAGEENKATEGTQMRFLKLFGTFQAMRYTVTQAFDAIREGAQSLDLDRVLGTQISGFTQLMDDVRKSTAGMVSDQGLKKSVALMTSFGIPTEGLADSLGLVQKMAIRTGQSAEFLSESFARGISRLSPLILDNLGIQVSLKDANEAYAKSIGKTTDQLTKAEQTTALMNETLRLLKKNTEGIDLDASAGGSIARFETILKNALESVKEFGAGVVVGLEQAFASAGTNAQYVASNLNLVAAGMKDLGRSSESAEDIRKVAKALQDFASDDELVRLFQGQAASTIGELVSPERLKNQAEIIALNSQEIGILRDRVLELNEAWILTDANLNELEDTTIPDLMIKNVQAAEAMAKEQLESYRKQVEARGAVLTKAEEERKLDELTKLNKKAILDQLGRINIAHWNNKAELARQLLILLDTRRAYQLITEDLFNQAYQHERATKAQRDAMAIMDRRLKGHEDELAFQMRRTAMLDGQIRSEVELGELKSKLAATEERYNEQIAAYKEAQNDADKKAALDKLDGLRFEMLTANAMYKAAAGYNADQLAYIAKFKDATKDVVDAEVVKLRTQAEQLRLQASQLEIMLRILAAGKDINTEQIKAFQLQADNAEAMAKRLGSGKDRGGGGGRGGEQYTPFKVPKKQEQEYRNYIERMADASDKARELMDRVQMQGQNGFSPFGQDVGTLLGVDAGDIREQKAALEDIVKQYERFSKVYGDGAVRAFFDGTGWDLDTIQQANAYFDQMAMHMERMRDVSNALTEVSTVLDSFAAGMDGLFGADIITSVNDMTRGLEQLAEAFSANKDAYDLTLAGIPALRAFTSFFVKDLKTRAWFEMAMQAAASWAAFATPGGTARGIMHATAATMYGLVAGGVLRLPKGKSKDDTKGAASDRTTPLRRDVHINIAGPIATTEAERGAMIRDAIRAAEREGI